MRDIVLVIASVIIGVISFLLIRKLKDAYDKESNKWTTCFILENALFSVSMLLFLYAIIDMVSVRSDFLQMMFFIIFASFIISPVTYYLLEYNKYPEKYQKHKLTGQIELVPGSTYIVEEPKIEKGIQLFIQQLAKGTTGFCITKTNPKELIEEHKELANAKINWLTKLPGENTLKPTELEELSYTINNFLSSAKNALIFFDGFVDLVNYNSFVKIFHLFQVLNDNVASKKAIMILPISPGTLEPSNLRLVELEFKVI